MLLKHLMHQIMIEMNIQRIIDFLIYSKNFLIRKSPIKTITNSVVEGLKDFYIGVNELREIRDEDQKPIVNKLVFNMRNKTQKTQNDLIPGIEALPSDKYIFPQESAIEVAKREKCLIQEYKIKKETKELLKTLTEKLMEK